MRGMELGILSSVMSWSDILLSTLTMALRLLPWAVTITRLPDLMAGTIVLFQYGNTLSTVSFKLLLIKWVLKFWVAQKAWDLCIFYRIWGVFSHFHPFLEEEYHSSCAISGPDPCRVFRQFIIYWVPGELRSVFRWASNSWLLGCSGSLVLQLRSCMSGWLCWELMYSTHRTSIRFVWVLCLP